MIPIMHVLKVSLSYMHYLEVKFWGLAQTIYRASLKRFWQLTVAMVTLYIDTFILLLSLNLSPIRLRPQA